MLLKTNPTLFMFMLGRWELHRFNGSHGNPPAPFELHLPPGDPGLFLDAAVTFAEWRGRPDRPFEGYYTGRSIKAVITRIGDDGDARTFWNLYTFKLIERSLNLPVPFPRRADRVLTSDPTGTTGKLSADLTIDGPALVQHHTLKTWPEPFQASWVGAKPFEVRKDDRRFAVGDTVTLVEYDPNAESGGNPYSGRAILGAITYKVGGGTDSFMFGLPPELCVLGIATIQKTESVVVHHNDAGVPELAVTFTGGYRV